MTNKIPAGEIKAGDVIMPPARELSLWMRRVAKGRGLSDEALQMTVIEAFEGAPDAKGRWVLIHASYSDEFAAGRACPPATFRARPETPWPVISRAAP